MSQWDERSTVVENIQLPHTLLSRFDLIFLMLDPQDEQFDRRLATHLVSLYHQSKEDEENVYMVSGVNILALGNPGILTWRLSMCTLCIGLGAFSDYMVESQKNASVVIVKYTKPQNRSVSLHVYLCYTSE